MTPPRAVLLMARDPGVGAVRPELEAVLGPGRCAALERALLARAAAWAARVAPGRVWVAVEPAGGRARLADLPGEGVTVVFAQGDGDVSARLGGAVARVIAEAPLGPDGVAGPVLIIWPELAQWRDEHAAGALDDIAAGCGVSIGPVFDGGFYLVALAAPVPSLWALPATAWDSPDAIGLALEAVHREGLEAGLLGPERGLRRPGDVRAALADPLLDPELREILR